MMVMHGGIVHTMRASRHQRNVAVAAPLRLLPEISDLNTAIKELNLLYETSSDKY
jgi:hypothetical protein